MNQHYSDARKITPGRKPDGTPDDNDRVEIGPTPLAFAEWAKAGLDIPNLAVMRQARLDRLVAMLHARDLAGILMFDPLNIRYASDTTNMQLWNAHNPFRACLVLADGHMMMWDFKGCGDLLTAHNPLVRETRKGTASFFYFSNGDHTQRRAVAFAHEIDEIVRAHCGTNRRLAIDKIMVHGLRAFEAVGFEVHEGEEVTEKARAVKSPEEIKAMYCAVQSCEASMAVMERAVAPGMTEDDIWAVLHAENIRRGGEWIETRLLASGQRTNPWFQECGPRVMADGDILAFDTDLVGPYGMCTDISRTWLVGDGAATPQMIDTYRIAVEHIETNTAMLGPGVALRELTFGGHMLPDRFVAQRYGAKMHGVGLCDEWPLVTYPEDYAEGMMDYVLEPGMMMCVEVYLGEVGGPWGIKLEDQVLITETGYERMNRYRWDPRLMGEV
ncbi:Xaa-Pro aminopeptidase [Rubricella aquisinus]|uniref:Xaa-Pro aminopeptidase n=1 Tax=Rubricella aquisinus TaxID=2028108 RepID=A0A840WWQ1_9RHOB|nr:dimethylsulfonioproprionate lyase DddP [Rubricella aquisinus]MBB5514744.1 Xaa-Pro aminopeptidase [Rubricella aquisinus]